MPPLARRVRIVVIVAFVVAACARGETTRETATEADTAFAALRDSIATFVAQMDAEEAVVPTEGLLSDSTDFIVKGLEAGTDTAAVRARLGGPDSARVAQFTLTPESYVATWRYAAAEIEFDTHGKLRTVTLRDSSYSTARGLRVGDSVGRMRALYGEPHGSTVPFTDYRWVENRFRAIRLGFQSDRVLWIRVGWLEE